MKLKIQNLIKLFTKLKLIFINKQLIEIKPGEVALIFENETEFDYVIDAIYETDIWTDRDISEVIRLYTRIIKE